MTETLAIISVVLSLAVLAFLVVMVILLARSRKSKGEDILNDKDWLEANAELKARLDQVSESIPLHIANALKSETVNALGTLNKVGEQNSAKLERFQESITGSLDKKFAILNAQLTTELAAINKRVDERLEVGFKGTNETVQSVISRLAKIDEAQKNIESLSSDVVSLRSILENNQKRGQYGEFQLKMILHNVFGDNVGSYAEQYVLRKGKDEASIVRADAVVFLPPPYHLLCIDAKFPFENYKKIIDARSDDPSVEEEKKGFRAAVKKHITDIRNKYIIKDRTAPQAFMFIPSDGIFAYLHVEMFDLVQEAQRANVILTSPATLQSTLATLLMLKINYEKSRNMDLILDQLRKLAGDFRKWGESWNKLSRNLTTVENAQKELDTRVQLMSEKFTRIDTADIAQKKKEIPLADAGENEEEKV